ncbi:sensor histidine kinase [Acinetobacter faecalis]|uniref:sensor histidine kinase n=1 Tax=Acinetobacter faecalis TaxID=2665161 RepID=UPI002A909C4D|nr:HAMP domain-containing sensor histidine kinase [Acinetobacter faecalis]MDY6488865.1 HAMP domain-containing sensor histidine kinase [Acinetobacter faecalis]
MKLELLEIGEKTEQLGACRLSLLLGILSKENQIVKFLKFACGMLQMDYGILVFKDEPYGWLEFDGECHAFLAQPHEEYEHFFLDQAYIDENHPHYNEVSEYILERGVEHKRFVTMSLKHEGRSIGHVVLYDERTDRIDNKQLSIVLEFVQSLVNIIKLRLENAELKEISEQRSALNASKTKFFQIIAHDLRAPFHGLMGFSDVLAHERNTLDDQGVQDIAEYLFETSQSTYNLLENLLQWAMAEGGRFVYHPISFDLTQLTTIVQNVLASLAAKKNIEIISQVSPHLKVYADINMITSVIQNLVSNALKFTYTDGNGKVIMSADEDEQYVHIYVQDTGLGMNEKQMQNIFDPNFTVSIRGTSGEKGTGLGLVLCKRFVDLNHGAISVSSKEGVGTTFKVSLPKNKKSALAA